MCNYQGYEFGAGNYQDSYCVDGFLHDADSDCLTEEKIPCPVCDREAAIEWRFNTWQGTSDVEDERPWEVIDREHKERAISLVDDIRKNRGLAVEAIANVGGA